MKTALSAIAAAAILISSSWASATAPLPAGCEPCLDSCHVEWVEACPSCPEGADAEDCACVTQEIGTCIEESPFDSCDAQTPCDGGLVCVSFVSESCEGHSAGALPTVDCRTDEDGEIDCPEADEPPSHDETCTTVEEAYCVPPYLAPCEEDRDCGSGFTCDQPEICEVSVSVAGGTETETEPVCESFGEKECRLVEAACTTDDDCIDGFACHSEAQPTPLIICMGEGCEDRSMPETRSYCAPEEWSAWGGHSRGGLDGGNAIRTDGEVLERKRVEQTAFFPVQGREKDDIGGCSVAGSGPGGHLAALLMLIGFARLGRRRRG